MRISNFNTYVADIVFAIISSNGRRFLQVSQLVILHEEAEDGNAMPDLAKPIQAVGAAVANLVKVRGEQTGTSVSND